jgi:hypothetical protein
MVPTMMLFKVTVGAGVGGLADLEEEAESRMEMEARSPC